MDSKAPILARVWVVHVVWSIVVSLKTVLETHREVRVLHFPGDEFFRKQSNWEPRLIKTGRYTTLVVYTTFVTADCYIRR